MKKKDESHWIVYASVGPAKGIQRICCLAVLLLLCSAPKIFTQTTTSDDSGLRALGIGLSLGGTTGYAINPARDLGPRIAHAVLPIAGKGGSDWSYAGIPVVGPLVGASLAGLLVHSFHF
jgi:glycerol uptake facilitator-like aquaporin